MNSFVDVLNLRYPVGSCIWMLNLTTLVENWPDLDYQASFAINYANVGRLVQIQSPLLYNVGRSSPLTG